MQTVESLFSGLSEIDRKTVLDLCTTRKVRKREEIVSEGSAGRDMFIVISGHLRVSTISNEGKEISFGVLGENEYFGELSLLDGRRRSATVTAIEDGEVLVFSYHQYQRLLKDHSHIATHLLTRMLTTMANRLRSTDELYQDAVFLDVSARLAKFLLNSSGDVEGSGTEERVLDLGLSQYEIGTLINASRESVNKQLRDWEHQGKIQASNGKILIMDTEFLLQKANGE